MIVDKPVRMYSSFIKDKEREKEYHLEIKRFPTLRSFLWAEIYHRYDMVIPIRIPGWGRFEEWLRKHDADILIAYNDPPRRLRDRLLGWSVEQDIRCFGLGERAKTVAVIKLDKETWDKLSRKYE